MFKKDVIGKRRKKARVRLDVNQEEAKAEKGNSGKGVTFHNSPSPSIPFQ